MSDTTYEPTGEVRIALVLYGGVSLAIYMNGIVQELLALVRSSAPKLDANGVPTSTPLLADDELRGAQRVYREIAKQLDRGKATADSGDVIRSRMVVDLLTGTSAGGINGIFLAKALAEERSIDALTNLWVEQGDISNLLNDRNAADGVPGMAAPQAPESLLSGERMLYELLNAMTGVSASASTSPQRSALVDELDLWITTTDLRGRSEQVDIDALAREQYELGHRKTFHFRYDTGLNDAQVTVETNDFTAPHDPMLAFAARCTSSFPGAFPPARLTDVRQAVAELNEGRSTPIAWDPAGPYAKPFFAEYGTDPAMYETVCFADGGYLDNHPVDLIMNTLPKRRASLPVSRRVLLIDPDPKPGNPPGVPPAEPVDLLSTVTKVVTLPRADVIADDVARIQALREPAFIRSDVYAKVEQLLAEADEPIAASPLDTIAYDELRILQTVQDLATGLARVVAADREYGPQSPWAIRLLDLLGIWRRSTPPVGQNPETVLLRLDIDQSLRKINFLQGRIDAIMREKSPSSELRAARTSCASAYQRLATAGRRMLIREGNPISAQLDELARALGPSPSATPTLAMLMALDATLTAVAGELTAARTAAETACEAALTDLRASDDRARLRTAWQNFTVFDQATYALAQLLPGENIDLDVRRISPRDSTMLVDEERTQHKKLAGAELHHFGAFLEADWRRNDILWGRLDAAEGVIKAIYPDNDRRAGLIERAHHAIVVEALGNPGYRRLLLRQIPRDTQPSTDLTTLAGQVLDGYRNNYTPPPPPSREDAVHLASRSLRVIERVGDTMSRGATGAVDTVSTWLGRVLKIVATTVDLALPSTTIGYYGAHLVHLVILAAAIMVFLGSVSSHAGVVGFGWEVIAAGVALLLAASAVRAWIHRRRPPWVVPVTLVVVGLVVCAVVFTDDWGQLLVVSLIGLAVGLILGAVTSRKPDKTKPGTKLPPSAAAIAIAVLAVIGVGAVGGAAARDHARSHLCAAGQGWWKHPTRNVLGLTCPPPGITVNVKYVGGFAPR
ncbi:MAG TPA: patatin-like protein [Mycobacteriales bacterium]|nr:patatin-like protein [Mycobacteriales bacterium]